MPVDHIVSNITEAVKFASDWKAKGTHSWFRGQNQPWPLVSSLSRVTDDPQKFEWSQARIGHFCSWVKDMPALKHLLEEEHVHALFAVLQHYGVLTHYVDFTTEPDIAGFFAAYGPDVAPGTQGCIICIDPDDMVDLLRTASEVTGWQKESWPEKVIVSVNDLWRMQVQSGYFLYLPRAGVEHIYGYDRILFTHDETPYAISEERVYPKRKSALELQLDEFFTKELMLNNQLYFRELFEQWKKNELNVSWANFERPDESEHLKPGAKPHDSWLNVDERWTRLPGEDFHETAKEAPEVTITFSPNASGADIDDVARQAVNHLFDTRPDCRTKLVRWTLVAEDATLSSDWQSRLERVWDGMRRLPYTDQQVVTALAATLAKSARPVSSSSSIKLELASAQGVTSQADVEAASVLAAFRDDLAGILRHPEIAENPRLPLQILSPAHLFDFEKLVDLFAKEIIPGQVLRGRSDLAVFFSPAAVTIIGLA